MAFGVLNSVTGNTAFLAAAGNNFSAAVDIMFYINGYKIQEIHINTIKHSITTTWTLPEMDGNINKNAAV